VPVGGWMLVIEEEERRRLRLVLRVKRGEGRRRGVKEVMECSMMRVVRRRRRRGTVRFVII